MIYKHLPTVGRLGLPRLEHHQGNSSSRYGVPVRRVWDHRWGGGTYGGVINEFEHAVSQASSHFVYAGEVGKDKGRCVQMVPLARKSWTEAAYNRSGVSIECADAVWLGEDPVGFARLARMNAYLLHFFGLPPVWVRRRTFGNKGFCRHADGGIPAGGHLQCPTVDMELWGQFVGRVQREYAYGGFRKKAWAR